MSVRLRDTDPRPIEAPCYRPAATRGAIVAPALALLGRSTPLLRMLMPRRIVSFPELSDSHPIAQHLRMQIEWL